MDQNITTEGVPTENTIKEKKPLCAWSIIAFVVSLAAVGSYCLVLGSKIRALIPVWEGLGVISVFLPATAKKIRISKDQSGKGFETAAIVLGGFAFYSIVFLMTKVSLYVGYLGWIVGGLIYKFVGRENK